MYWTIIIRYSLFFLFSLKVCRVCTAIFWDIDKQYVIKLIKIYILNAYNVHRREKVTEAGKIYSSVTVVIITLDQIRVEYKDWPFVDLDIADGLFAALDIVKTGCSPPLISLRWLFAERDIAELGCSEPSTSRRLLFAVLAIAEIDWGLRGVYISDW